MIYQDDTVDSVIDELTTSLDMVSMPAVNAEENDDLAISPAKKRKVNVLEKILGDKFDTQPGSIGTVTVSHNKIVQAEISRYKRVPSIKLSEKPLPWWNLHQHSFPKWLTSILA